MKSTLRWTVIVGLLALAGGGGNLRAQTWDGGGTNNTWNTNNNWNPNGTPSFNNSTSITFSGSIRLTPDMNGSRRLNALTFGSGADAFTLVGDSGSHKETLTFSGTAPSLTQLSARDQTMIMNRINWAADGTIDVSSAGSLTLGNATAKFGELYGSANLTKTGTGGSLILNADNSNWSGGLLVSVGTVEARYSGDALGGGGVTVASGATLLLGTGGLTFANGLTLAGDGTAGAGALRNNASSSVNTVSGAIALSADTRLGADMGGALNLTGDVTGAGRTLTIDTTGGVTLAGALATGSGGLVKEGAGTLTLASAMGNSFTGATLINAGTLIAAASDVLNSPGLITVGMGAVLSLVGSTSQLVGSLAGTGTIIIGAGATLTLGADFSAPNLNLILAGGTLALSGSEVTLGELSITGDSVVDFGGGGSALTVTDIVFANTGLELTAANWVDLSNYFYAQSFGGAMPDTRGSLPQNQIVFDGYSSADTAWLSFDQQITPVPEPAWGLPLLGGALILVRWRRRTGRRPA